VASCVVRGNRKCIADTERAALQVLWLRQPLVRWRRNHVAIRCHLVFYLHGFGGAARRLNITLVYQYRIRACTCRYRPYIALGRVRMRKKHVINVANVCHMSNAWQRLEAFAWLRIRKIEIAPFAYSLTSCADWRRFIVVVGEPRLHFVSPTRISSRRRAHDQVQYDSPVAGWPPSGFLTRLALLPGPHE